MIPNPSSAVDELTWPDVLTALVNGQDLSSTTAAWAMNKILTNEASPVQIAGFAVGLRTKGETVAEISGLAEAMRANALPVNLDSAAVDIVGSGGDRANTVNISTMAAIVAAAAGAKVVKHGNRAASSLSGTADCLEALGLPLDISPDKQPEVLDRCGIVFLFAALYHKSLRYSAGVRRELGIQTTFNFLGPLTNPAAPKAQAIGVADKKMGALMAGVLAERGCRGMVFHGIDGLDELTTTAVSKVWLISGGEVKTTEINPADLGLHPANLSELTGGKPEYNAQVVRETLNGKPGAIRDIVLLNAAAALLAYDGPQLETPLIDQIESRIAKAAEAIDSGQASEKLDHWIAVCKELAER